MDTATWLSLSLVCLVKKMKKSFKHEERYVTLAQKDPQWIGV